MGSSLAVGGERWLLRDSQRLLPDDEDATKMLKASTETAQKLLDECKMNAHLHLRGESANLMRTWQGTLPSSKP